MKEKDKYEYLMRSAWCISYHQQKWFWGDMCKRQVNETVNEIVGESCTIVMDDITTVMDNFIFPSQESKVLQPVRSCIMEVQKKNSNQKRQRSGERLPSCYDWIYVNRAGWITSQVVKNAGRYVFRTTECDPWKVLKYRQKIYPSVKHLVRLVEECGVGLSYY